MSLSYREIPLCACGCDQPIRITRPRDYAHRFIYNHHWRMVKMRPWKRNPDSESVSTGHWRAKLVQLERRCALEHITGCLGQIDVHHVDKNPLNNDIANLVPLCKSHHRLIENGRLTLQSTVMPPFTIISGQRRYKWSEIGQ